MARWSLATVLLGLLLGTEALGHDLALVDPALHADSAGRRLGLDEAVVDVCSKGVERHAAIGVALRARHLGATEAARDLDLHALRAGAHGGGQGPLHRAAKRHAVLQLLGDRLGDQLGVELRALDLLDVDLDRLTGELVELAAQGVDLGPGLADHDPGARGGDVDLDLARALLDRDLGETRVRELVLDVRADLQVLVQVVREIALVVPVRLPVVDVADPESLWVDFLSHTWLSPPASAPRRCGWFAC